MKDEQKNKNASTTLKNDAITKDTNTQQRRMVSILSPSDIPIRGKMSVFSKRVLGLVKKHSVIYRIDLFLSRNYVSKSYSSKISQKSQIV